MILMIYSAGALKEYMLPRRLEEVYVIEIPGNYFKLQEDLQLHFEASRGIWKIKADSRYRLYINTEEVPETVLKGSIHIRITTEKGGKLHLIGEECHQPFPVFQKMDISHTSRISIGRGSENDISYQFQEWISHTHAILLRRGDEVWIEDVSTNGIFFEGRRVLGSRRLEYLDEVNIFGLHLVFLGEVLAVATRYGSLRIQEEVLGPVPVRAFPIIEEEPERSYFNRSPRQMPSVCREPMEIEGPPALMPKKERPLLLTIGPAFTMAIPMMLGSLVAILGSRATGRSAGFFMYTGLITAVTSALLGSVWALLNLRHAREEALREEEERFGAYGNYLIEIAERIKEEYLHNQQAMSVMYPSANVCCTYGANHAALWSRNLSHGDFLFVRLGLGDIPFQVPIRIPEKKFSVTRDSLRDKPGMILEEYRILRQVPVGIDLLKKRLVGIVGGPDKSGACEVVKLMAAQIGAGNCYTDVKMAFLSKDTGMEKVWEAVKWLPHVWSQDGRTRYVASNPVEAGDVFYELAGIFRRRAEESTGKGRGRIQKPHYVLFLESASMLEGELLAKYVLEPKEEYGLTALILADSCDELPNACEDIVEMDQDCCAIYNVMDITGERQAVLFDHVDTGALCRFARSLASVRVSEVETSQEIPTSLGFLKMYGASRLAELKVQQRWKGNKTYHSMKALIGQRAGGRECFLDIHEKYHGPHGLVAGTTGSGKSELLQTYILSLALQFSPDDAAFFLIDFKGGGMANLFQDLPHMAGKITNLSGNQIRRAMISIKSENQRRQRIFQKYGVNNINSYTKLYKNQEADLPVPHLMIIIDEFAELKKEEPEFMQELISVAQVGRSLGVHLILATQKPCGVVSENIRSNAKFRLCLRVQDRQDSMEMLHKPDAAYLTQAGRCYLQVGNDELYELFQSGYSGGSFDEDQEKREGYIATMLTTTGKEAIVGSRAAVRRMSDSGQAAAQKKPVTELEAVVRYLKQQAEELGYVRRLQLWLPLLKKELYLEELPGYREYTFRDGKWQGGGNRISLETMVGLLDDPENQAQVPLTVDLLEDGHLAVLGTVASGKSTFLQTFIYAMTCRYTPDEVQMYLLDFGNRILESFAHMPHVGGVVFENQEEKLSRLFFLLERLVGERKRMLKGGTYVQYLQSSGESLPAMVVVIDGYAGFREKTKNRYEDFLVQLAREGTGCGIYLVFTAGGFGANEIASRIGSHFRSTLALEMGDRFQYLDALRVHRIEVVPEADCKGRGLANTPGGVLEFQTALALRADDDYERGNKIREAGTDMAEVWKGRRPKRIPEIPENPQLSMLAGREEYRSMVKDSRYLPYAYRLEDAEVYGVDLLHCFCYLIGGKRGSGKSNLLKLLLFAAGQKRARGVVIGPEDGTLKGLAAECRAVYLSDSEALFAFFQDFAEDIRKRNHRLKQLRDQGEEGLVLFEHMQEETPTIFFIDNLECFFENLYHPKPGTGDMRAFVEMMMEKGMMHNFYFIGCLNTEDYTKVINYRAFQSFIRDRKGVYLGGNLAMQKLFQFQNFSHLELTKPVKKGMAMAVNPLEEAEGEKLVIPLAGMPKSGSYAQGTGWRGT